MTSKTNGGIMARLGEKFHEEIEKIKTERIRIGKSKERVSTEKLTNLIVKHKEAWALISKDLINLKEEELEKLWH